LSNNIEKDKEEFNEKRGCDLEKRKEEDSLLFVERVTGLSLLCIGSLAVENFYLVLKALTLTSIQYFVLQIRILLDGRFSRNHRIKNRKPARPKKVNQTKAVKTSALTIKENLPTKEII
jgi:hypothetical protein